MHIRSLLATLAATMTAAAGAADAISEADMRRILPPPGLYRVDASTGTTTVVPMGLSIDDQQSGDVATQTHRGPDGQVLSRTISAAQETTCVPPPRPGVPFPLPRHGPSICKNISSTVTGDTLKLVAQCQTGRLTQTIQRLADNQWETSVDTEFGGGRLDPEKLRPMLEMAARHGATEADRNAAKGQLAALPQLKARTEERLAEVEAAARRETREGRTPADREAARKMLHMLENPDSVPPPIKVAENKRWTRIGDRCAPGQQ